MRKFLFDLGSYNGDSVEWFWQNTGSFFRKRGDSVEDYYIYCFEPNAKHHKLEEKFQGKKVKVIDAAASINDGMIKFKNAPDSLSSCSALYSMQCYDESYATLEDVKSVDFVKFFKSIVFDGDYVVLKIDIESSEYQLIPDMLKNNIFPNVNELYIEFHHTIKDWEIKKEELCNQILEQCPTIFFDRDWQ